MIDEPPMPGHLPVRKRVYLHIGTSKTGSSFLQNTLSSHQDELRREGVYYPQTGRDPLFRDNGHHLLAISLMRDRWQELELSIPEKALASVWSDLVEEIMAVKENEILLSSEWFAFDVYEMEQFAQIKSALSAFDVKIVVILRDVVDFVNSIYSQRVRDGFDGTVVDYIKLAWPHLNWRNLVSRWADNFGEENVISISYDYLCDRNYVADFSRITFGREILMTHRIDPDVGHYNHSLSASATRTLIEINKSDLPVKDRELIRDEIRRVYNHSSLRYKPIFIEDQLSSILRFTCDWPEVKHA